MTRIEPCDDPFARMLPAQVLHVDSGALGVAPAPAGATIERCGSANPLPGDRFA